MSATCTNHPGAPATSVCSSCAKPFCADCTVDFQDRPFCGACKTSAIQQATAAAGEWKLPAEALKYAVIGIFCFGIILEPIAVVKAVQALNKIGADPSLPGRGKAVAALVIAGTILALNLVYIALMATRTLNHP